MSFAKVFEKAVGSSVNIGVIYDRDYIPQEHVDDILTDLNKHLSMAHIHYRKEMENYLLIPNALEKSLKKSIYERSKRCNKTAMPNVPIIELLDEITSPLKSEIQAQYMAKRSDYFKSSKIDNATINAQTIKIFEDKWSEMNSRMQIVPGKEVLRKLREKIQNDYSVNLTDTKIINEIEKEDIPLDLIELLEKLEIYRNEN